MARAHARFALPLLALFVIPWACEPRRGARSAETEPTATATATTTAATTTTAPPTSTPTTTPTTASTPTGVPSTPPPSFDPAVVLGPAWTPGGIVLPPGWSPNPTGAPWPIPTTFPTSFPTGLPTGMPTAFPFPTSAPTTTGAPTTSPTSAPTGKPPTTPSPPSIDGWPAQSAAMEEVVLLEVNKRRAAGAVCGGKAYPAVSPLTMDPALRNAARRHSKDMATRGFFDHTNPDGQGMDDRIRAAGFLGATATGENIAAGGSTPAGTVQQWMDSPGHCTNIMYAGFQKIGVGYFNGPGSKYGHYWTQNFAGN